MTKDEYIYNLMNELNALQEDRILMPKIFTFEEVRKLLKLYKLNLAQEIEKKVALCEAKINKSLIDNGGWTFFGEKEDLRELKILGEVLAIINSQKTEGGKE